MRKLHPGFEFPQAAEDFSVSPTPENLETDDTTLAAGSDYSDNPYQVITLKFKVSGVSGIVVIRMSKHFVSGR